jgi:hypothetical protein
MLRNIASTTTKLSLKNLSVVEIKSVVNDDNDGSQVIISPLYVLVVNKSGDIYNALNIGNGSTETGCSLVSSNSVYTSHNNLLHKAEVTANQTNICNVNGLVFSHNVDGVIIRDFRNTNHVLIPWDN